MKWEKDVAEKKKMLSTFKDWKLNKVKRHIQVMEGTLRISGGMRNDSLLHHSQSSSAHKV